MAKRYDSQNGFDNLIPIEEGGLLTVFDKSNVQSGMMRTKFGLLLPKDGNPLSQSDTPAIEVSVSQPDGQDSLRARVWAHFVKQDDEFALANREEAILHTASSPDFLGPGVIFDDYSRIFDPEPLFELAGDVIRDPEYRREELWAIVRGDFSEVRQVETALLYKDMSTKDSVSWVDVEATGELFYEVSTNDPGLRSLLTH